MNLFSLKVIKEPVYVYQKPQTSSRILSSVFGENLSVPGFFQGWAIFGNEAEKKVEQSQSIGVAVEPSRTGENLRSAVDSQSDETELEDPEAIATKSTPLESTDIASEREGSIDEEAIEEIVEALEEGGLEDVPKSYVDENEPESEVIKILLPEEATADAEKVENRDSAKSANSLEEVPDAIASEVNAELTGPIEVGEPAAKSIEEESAAERSSADLSESHPSDSALGITENKETDEKPERNTSPQSENVVEENIDDPDDESAIETDA